MLCGGYLEEILSALEGTVARRTLQRRLAFLVEQKRLIVQGRARASRDGLSTGPLEGTNNKIKTMQRKAYG